MVPQILYLFLQQKFFRAFIYLIYIEFGKMVFPSSNHTGIEWNDCGDKKYTAVISSPIGQLNCTYCSKGIHSLKLMEKWEGSKLVHQINEVKIVRTSKEPEVEQARPVIESCATWLTSYFSGSSEALKDKTLTLCLKDNETSFEQTCQMILPALAPFGKTITYSDVAKAAGKEKASRAAGSAMRRNKFIIIIPCHRVVHKSGKKCRYSGGADLKVWLQKHEKQS